MATKKQLKDKQAFAGGDRDVAQEIETTFQQMVDSRFKFERQWHENNFFDDGFHYRFISGDTRQIIDYADGNSISNPRRAIPKSSRQIRGIINLLLANRPTPVPYPESLLEANFSSHDVYMAARERESKDVKNISIWLLSEWERLRFLPYHLPYMLLLAAKNSASYLQIYPNNTTKMLSVNTYDAFDIVLSGELSDIEEEPLIIKACPQYMDWIWNHPKFENKEKVLPDNLFSASKIKQNYMQQKYGSINKPHATDTAIIKEALIKTYVDGKVLDAIKKQKDAELFFRVKEGDVILRQVFVGSGFKLYDKFLPLTRYNIIDFRYEPGAIYQTPLLERFKPANKVLDNIISRVERNLYSISGGKYWRRKGDDWEMTNDTYGQVIESVTPPQPVDTPTVPGFVFDMVGLMTSFIEEQGVTTSALGKIPSGVRSGKMIESLKESEYANLTMPLEQVKDTVRRAAEVMIDLASKYYVNPQRVNYQEGADNYEFDVIGEVGARQLNNEYRGGEMVGATVLKPNRRFRVDIENGMGYTAEGKRQNATELVQLMADMANKGLAPMEAVKEVVSQLLRSYQFGATAEIMQSYDKFVAEAPQNAKDRMAETKIAVVEALKDLGLVGKDMENMQVNATKVGVMEAAKDMQTPSQPTQPSV